MEFIFTFVISTLIYFEYKLYKTFLNPFIIISGIYLLMIPFNNFFGVRLLDFYKVDSDSIVYILYFLIIIFLISIFFRLFKKKDANSYTYNIQNYEHNITKTYSKFILLLFCIGVLAKYISLFQSINMYGIENIKGKSFGIFAHIGSLSTILLPYILILYLDNKKKAHYLILIILVFFNLFLFGGKYNIFISFIHMIIFYGIIRNINIRKTLKYVLLTVFVGVLVFIGIYAVKPLITLGYFDKNLFIVSLEFSVKHFFSYLFGPLISTNYFFHNNIDSIQGISIMFTVPINIVKAIFSTGDYIYPAYTFPVPISDILNTNVGGLFAESVYNSGFLVATIYITVFFSIVYYFYNNAMSAGGNIALVAYMLSVISMMFFGNFLTLSGIVLNFIYLYVIEIILKKKIVF
ncbi:O-antigen polymerase [Paenibacillus sp. FSL P2-0121]|uniref:O-antigen polymerase n=1 Tax=unclassified Paenibacillus TaxID=185978 RepID=UPI0030D433D3